MSRTARVWSGVSIAVFFLIVALTGGLVWGVSAARDSGFDDFFAAPVEPVEASAEIIDVDDDPFLGDVFADISFEADGEGVVTWVEWFGEGTPRVGASMAIVYDATDPEYAFDALDPLVGGDAPDDEESATDAGSDPGRVPEIAGWVSLASLFLALLIGALTVPFALAVPARPRTSPYDATVAPTGYPPLRYGHPQPYPPSPDAAAPHPAPYPPPPPASPYAPIDWTRRS